MELDSLLPVAVANPAVNERNWSDQQKAVFDFVTNGKGHGQIEAVAGSGKTTTIVASMNHARGTSTFLAFNKAIAETLKARVPMGADASTFNALGHRVIGKTRKFNQYYVFDLIKEIVPKDQREDLRGPIKRIVDLARANAWGITHSPESWHFDEMVDELDFDELENVAKYAQQVFEACIEQREQFDFSDQLYLPVAHDNLRIPTSDFVYVDEAQDLSHIQHLFLAKMVADKGRLIAVGDPNQAIYGFRGADSDSMEHFHERFSTHRMPLSVSYRCPKAVVREAQMLVPHIEWAQDAPEGKVSMIPMMPNTLDYNALVVCRTNAPLIRLAMRMMVARQPFYFMGDFGENLLSFIKSFKKDKTSDLIVALERWKAKEITKAKATENYTKIGRVEDKFDCIMSLIGQNKLTLQVLQTVQFLTMSKTGVRLATIHKAKGLEAQQVFLLRPDLVPSPYAKNKSQLQQENNLKYVAITRSLNELSYCVDTGL